MGDTASDSPSRESASPTHDGANGDINKRSLRVPSLALNELRTGLGLSIDPFAPPQIGEVVLGNTANDSPSRESASPTQGGANGVIDKRSLRVPSLALN